jgi:cell division protein FtsL
MAARRQAAQKPQQRSAASLIAAENYSYVRKDLLFILILAIIMFSAIIVLHFVIGG